MPDYKEFAQKIKAKYPEYKDVDDMTLSKKMIEKYPEYKDQVTFEPVKKKEQAEVLPSQSLGQKPSSATKQAGQQKYSGSSGDLKIYDGFGGKVYEGAAGKGKKKYVLREQNGVKSWYEYSSSKLDEKQGKTVDQFDKKITDPTRVSTINRKFGVQASTDDEAETFVGFPGKEQNEYRVSMLSNGESAWEVRRKGQKEFTTIANEGSINALNKQFKKDIKPSSTSGAVRGEQVARQKSALSDFKEVNADLIDYNEGHVVDFLNDKYKDRGFTFSEEGLLGKDMVRIRAENGAAETFSLDNWSSDTDSQEALKMRKFLSENQTSITEGGRRIAEQTKKEKDRYLDISTVDYQKQRDKLWSASSKEEFESAQDKNAQEFAEKFAPSSAEAADLREKIVANQTNVSRRIKDLSKTAKTKEEKQEFAAIYEANKTKIKEDTHLTSLHLRDLSVSSNLLVAKQKTIENRLEEFNNKIESNGLTKEEIQNNPELLAEKQNLEAQVDELSKEWGDMTESFRGISTIKTSNKMAAAQNFVYNETRGSVAGGLLNNAIRGAVSVLDMIYEGTSDEIISVLGSEMTTKEFEQSDDRWDITKAGFSVANSLGSMATSAGAGAALKGASKTVQLIATQLPFFATSYNEISNEMEGEEFKGMSKLQKMAVASVYGLGVGVLEKYGVETALGKGFSKSGAAKFIFGSISGLPKGASMDAIEAAIASNIKKTILARGLNAAGKVTVEGLVEGSQALYGEGLKSAVDWANNNKDIDGVQKGFLDKTVKEVFQQAGEEAYMGALGGLLMAIPGQTVAAFQDGFKTTSDEKIELLDKAIKDTESRNMMINDIKLRIMSGEITKDEGKRQVDSINEFQGLLGKIPENMSQESRNEAIKLVAEKSNLQKEIAGKDESLVAAQKERIKEIDASLAELSKTQRVVTFGAEVTERQEEIAVAVAEVERLRAEEKEENAKTEVRRKAELDSVIQTSPIEVVDDQGNVVQSSDQKAKINAKYDAELAETYDKYDKLISPLLNTDETTKEASETTKEASETTQTATVDKPTIATNSTEELTRVKALPIEAEDGATFNLDGTKYEGKGLVIPVASKNTTAEEITPEMLADFVEEHQDKIGEGATVKFGIYKFPNSNEVSIDLNVVAPESSREQAIEFGRLADQESLFDLSTFENVKTGGTGKNPMSFTAAQFKEISKAFSEGRMPNVFGDNVQQTEAISETEQVTSTEQDVDVDTEVSEIENLLGLSEQKAKEKIESFPKKWRKPIARAYRAMSKIAPNVQFIVHETSESFNNANPDVDRNQINRGLYVPSINGSRPAIHVNLEKAYHTTIPHEVFHAILIERVKTDKNAAAITKKMVEAIRGKIDPGFQDFLDNFISNYDENIQNEEFLAEFVGDLAENYELFGEGVIGIIKRWLDALAKSFGLDPFNRNEVLDMLNTIARKTAKGKVISESDVNMISITGVTTEIVTTNKPRKQVKVKKDQKLSFVKESDLIDIDGLINKISNAKQKVWFWVADQLGRGDYYDSVLNGEHFLDAGPSFALDPENRSKNIIWASGANVKTLNNNIEKSDYIFIISGSPQKSKLFNKTVANLVRRRIESVSDYNTFKAELLESKPTKNIKSILEKYDSFDELFGGADRKTFIIAVNEQKTKNTPAKNVLDKYNAFVDENNLRDGFYEDNGFDMGDIMLVLKPKSVGGKSNHSTYENDILGDVIGVPDKVVNAYDIMPKEIKDKYRDDMSRSEQSQVVAPYGIGVKDISPRSQKQQLPTTVANKLTDDGKGNYVFHHYSFVKRDEIKPGTGENSITSKDEASALSAVGGIAQYYTAGNQKEAGVGPNLHTVLIDKNAVYDFNSDPENFYEEAERRFNEVRPGQAFNPNYQLAFITQVANENGYDMVVAKWRENELRANTTKTLTPNEENVEMKPVEKEGFSVGDEVIVFGDKAIITEIKGDIVSYKGESSSGSINIDRNPRGIRYQKSGSIQKLIRKIKAAGFSDAGLTAALKKQGFSDVEISNALAEFNTKKNETLSKANESFDKALNSGKSKKDALNSALDFIKKFVTDDMEREHAINEFLKSNGERLTVSPSSKKVGGVKDVMVTVNERVELKKQILKENRDRKAGIKYFRDLQNEVISDIKGLETIGKLKATQLKSVLNRLAKTNILSESAREKFFNYVENVIRDSNYAQEISDLNKTRAAIKKKAKSKTLQNSVAVMAKNFANIDPFLVEDLATYKEIIERVKEAVKSSVLSGDNISIKTAVDISEVNEYANNEIARQKEIIKQQLLEEYQDLVDTGVINDKMDLDVIRVIISSINSKPESNKALDASRQFIMARFDAFAGIINEMLNNGELDIDPSVVSRLIGLNLNNVKTRDVLQLVEAMDNMVVNGIVDGVEAQIRAIEGANKAAVLAEKGVSVRPLRAMFNKKLGTTYNQIFTSLPLMLEKMFASKTKALAIMREMGFTELVKGVASANFESTKLLDSYLNKFIKTKPNGERFDSAKNNIERGFVAFLTRNVNGTDLEKSTEFARRVRMINETVEKLEKGTDKEIRKAAAYREVMNRLGVDGDSVTSSDVVDRADATNVDAVNFWKKEWADRYDKLSDISASVYNSVLGSDVEYTPDSYKTVEGGKNDITDEMISQNGGFSSNFNYTDVNKSGVLMASNRPASLPLNRYVDLDFDSVNNRAMTAAIIDMNTAASIRQVKGFQESDGFNKIFEKSPENKELIKRTINNYILEAKNKRFSDDNIATVEKILNTITSWGAAKALGGITQVGKQVIPVMMNTIINAGAVNFMSAIQDSNNYIFGRSADFQDFLERAGVPVLSRGLESIANVEAVDKRLNDKLGGATSDILNGIDSVTNFYLKNFLAKPDVWVARASFLAYYKQGLKRQGINGKFDLSNDINEDAAAFAQQMVDRQQNVSDAKLMGEFFRGGNTYKRVIGKLLMPFANFVMNQKNRMYSDVRQLISKEANSQDKVDAVKSLGGMVTEMAAFHVMSILIKEGIIALSNAYGKEEEDEEKEKRDKKQRKVQVASSFITDILSPLPIFDDTVVSLVNGVLGITSVVDVSKEDIDKAVDEENKLRLAEEKEPMTEKQVDKFIESYKKDNDFRLAEGYNGEYSKYGMYGILPERISKNKSMANAAISGEYDVEYNGNVTKKQLSKEKQDEVKSLYVITMLYDLGVLPTEFNQFVNQRMKSIKKSGMTEEQHEKYNEIVDALGEEFAKKSIKEIKSAKKAETIILEEQERIAYEKYKKSR